MHIDRCNTSLESSTCTRVVDATYKGCLIAPLSGSNNDYINMVQRSTWRPKKTTYTAQVLDGDHNAVIYIVVSPHHAKYKMGRTITVSSTKQQV